MKRNKILGKYIRLFSFTLGTVLGGLGLTLLFRFAPIYEYLINSALDIRPGTDAFNAWRTNEPPLLLDMYFFNWTNADQVYNGSVKPHFEQVGPYRLLEVKEKYNIQFHDNDTVSYEYVKRYYHVADSPRPLTDVINTVNAVALSAAYKARFLSSWKRMLLSMSISSTSKVYVTKTIDELLFTGYEDSLLNVIRTVAPFVADAGTIDDRFGWFYNRNDTYNISGIFSMHTGHDRMFGRQLTWNYRNTTDFFTGKCAEIHGSAGEFHPINQKRDAIELYSSEMCSYASLEYERDEVIKEVKAFKYSSNSLFDNGTMYPDNSCFCNGECIPSGVLNISECRQGAPIFLSLPHFYNADPYYTTTIDGLTPDKSLHDFYITLEPKTAIVVDLAARMQLNMLLQPIKGVSLYNDVPKIFVPVFFFDQVVTMNDDLAFNIKMLQDLPEISVTAAYILMFTGLLLIVFCLVWAWCSYEMDKSEKNKFKVALTQEDIPLRIKADH